MLNFTPEQKKIIEASPDINMCINACPGSGKTTTIVYKIAHMIQSYNIRPQQIALFTYSRALGKDMCRRLATAGIDRNKINFCGTIHSYCYKTTNKYKDLHPWLSKYSPDPSDPLKYLIFDEYQDCDNDIYAVVKKLGENKYLTIIGDSHQQLYSYRGADANLLPSLKPDFQTYILSETFRCNKNISALLSSMWGPDNAINSAIDGPRPLMYRSRGYSMNNPSITKEIIKIVDNHKEGSIAILSPIVNSQVVNRFLNDIQSNIYKRWGIIFDRKSDEPVGESQYVISSIHQAKGLEYDTVILLNAIDGKYLFDVPTFEAQCKLFVATSRAKQNLFIFEHDYHFSNGSIKWLTENYHLLDKPGEPMWNTKTQERVQFNKSGTEKNCREFIRWITNEQKRLLMAQYTEPEIVGEEEGLGAPVGDPQLCGELIEILMAVKLGFTIKIPLKPFITVKEWQEIAKAKEIPPSVQEKIALVYPYPLVLSNRTVDWYRTKITVLYVDHLNMKHLRGNNENMKSLLEIGAITEHDIISDTMCETYYQHIGEAVKIKHQLECSQEITSELVKKWWWMLRFRRLMDMSILDFTKDDLSDEEVDRVINYINTATILKNMRLTKYHSDCEKTINILPGDPTCKVNGEIDFEGDDTMVEFKCFTKDDFEEAWLQVIVYNIISSPTIRPKYRSLHVYNAISGTLYKSDLNMIYNTGNLNFPSGEKN